MDKIRHTLRKCHALAHHPNSNSPVIRWFSCKKKTGWLWLRWPSTRILLLDSHYYLRLYLLLIFKAKHHILSINSWKEASLSHHKAWSVHKSNHFCSHWSIPLVAYRKLVAINTISIDLREICRIEILCLCDFNAQKKKRPFFFSLISKWFESSCLVSFPNFSFIISKL